MTSPMTVSQMCHAIRCAWIWDYKGMSGRYVAVLSAPLGLGVGTKHALTDKVNTGAELVRANYMEKGIRERHPDAPVYFVYDKTTGQVLIALYRNGAVEEELDALRPDLPQGTRDGIREAVRAINPDALTY